MLFLVFLMMTLLEIYVLVSVGQSIGAFTTVLLVIITAFLGSVLLRQQGWVTLTKAQNIMAQGKTPAFEMLEGLVILLSGVLLLTPGFITDFIGLLGLMPFSRAYFIEWILQKNVQKIFASPVKKSAKKPNNHTIEGEFWED